MSEVCCSVCDTRDEQAFSKRQLKRAAERKPARCSKCIEQDLAKKDDAKQEELESGKVEKAQTEENKDDIEKENLKPAAAMNLPKEKKERMYFSDGESVSEQSSGSDDAQEPGAWSEDEQAQKSPQQQQEDDEEEVQVSLDAIKQQVLGRAIRVDHDDNVDPSIGEEITTKSNLRKELSCAICHEPFYQPLSLHCGHSFCKECFHWWITHSSSQQNSENHGTCPTCRQALTCHVNDLGVNTALRACVGALFAKDLQARVEREQQARLQATRGENDGAHSGGYVVLSDMQDEPWETVRLKNGAFLQMRRSVIMDAHDQRMQLSLALRVDENSFVRQEGDNILQVVVCMVIMEEDEACDGNGFPWIINENDEDDNDALVARGRGTSFMDVTARVSGSETVPVSRRGIRDGIARFLVDMSSQTLQQMASICFCEEESKAQLEIKVPEQRWLEGNGEPSAMNQVHSNRVDLTADHDDDDSHLDQFEDDGFVVLVGGEGDEDHQDDDDVCCLCKHGGDLMVCDGGLNSVEGCGRNFHLECVGRDCIPPGDWVCETCANEHDLDVGLEGHEFPVTEAEEEAVGEKGSAGQATFEDSDRGEESDDSAGESQRRATKKRRVILDSDEEEDDKTDRHDGGHDPDDFEYGHDQEIDHSENEDMDEEEYEL